MVEHKEHQVSKIKPIPALWSLWEEHESLRIQSKRMGAELAGQRQQVLQRERTQHCAREFWTTVGEA
jgi:hypothetical protein